MVLSGEGSQDGGLTEADREALSRFQRLTGRLGKVLREIFTRPAPKIESPEAGDLFTFATTAMSLRRLGKSDLLELARILPMSLFDWLTECGFSHPVAESLAAEALWSRCVGPRAPGTAVNLLLAQCVSRKFIKGGPASLVEALFRACRANSVEIRTACRVDRIRTDEGRVSAVVLADGEEIETKLVVASCHPREACLELLAPGTLEVRLEERLRRLRSQGVASLLLLGLDGPLQWQSLGEMQAERSHIGGGSLDDLERCYDAVKYGTMSAMPFLEIRAEPQPGSDGRFTVAVLMLGTPYQNREGWSEPLRREMVEGVVKRLNHYTPRLDRKILASKLLTPRDIEQEFRIPGGNLAHVEPTLDQLLFMRPVPELARYATPLKGLFLGGSGSHPGGGVSGAPGFLAAREVLRRI